MKYQVTFEMEPSRTYEATGFDVEDGMLLLRSGHDKVATFAPGRWVSVERVPDAE